jgi:NitT/TauT family transport system substrate-binding protein
LLSISRTIPFLIALIFASPGHAETLRIGAQLTGTLGWELAYMKAHGLDKAAGLELEITDLANTEAGKVAIASGAVDIILSDWLWVSRERTLGHALTFVPYSSALGALMVKRDSTIQKLADLQGKSLGVVGGPLDKSWLLLQAYAKRDGLDLAATAKIAYAAPPLINQKAATGELDAALQFWNFCVDLQRRGFRSLMEISDVEKALGASGPVAIVGFVFSDDFAARHSKTLQAFLETARAAREALAADSGEWPAIMTRIGQKDPAAAELFRVRYAAGSPRRPLAEEEADAKILFKALAQIGGAELVGKATELDAGVYFKPHGGD